MKASPSLLRSSRALLRSSIPRPRFYSTNRAACFQRQPQLQQSFSSSHIPRKGLTPDSADPAPPNTEPTSSTTSNASAANISDSEYHEISDQYLNTLLTAIEEKAEDPSTGIEVEYSAGVLTVTHPRGIYVLNKQPPNKQIWLSSPVSGPKRYDWVVGGAGQHEKEGSEASQGDDGHGGRWIYLRDGSGLSELLADEVDVAFVPE